MRLWEERSPWRDGRCTAHPPVVGEPRNLPVCGRGARAGAHTNNFLRSLIVRLPLAPAVAVGVGATGHLPLCPYPSLRSHPILPCPLAMHPETRRLLVPLHPTAACARWRAHCLCRGWLTTHKSDIPCPLLSDINVKNQAPCDQTSLPLQEAPRTAPYWPVPPQQNRQFQRCSSGRCVEREKKGLPFHVRSASV